jgi:hypothetical protein
MKNKETNYVFLVVTPFQYLCALEYIHSKNLKKNECQLILLSHLPKSIKQIENIGFLHIFSIVDKPMLKNKNVWFNLFNTKRLIKSKKDSILILGNLLNNWCKYALDITSLKKDAIILDDGTSTLNVVRNRVGSNFNLEIQQSKSRIGYFTKYFLKPKKIWDKPLHFFSVFKFKENYLDKYSLNSLDFIKNSFKNESQKKINEVWFIGSPLVELGYISSEFQNNTLKNLLIFCKKKNLKLVYFSHRVEKFELLKEIEVRNNDLPFEVYYLRSEKIPEYIFSFVSTSLYTTSLFGTSTLFKAIYINSNFRIKQKSNVWENADCILENFKQNPKIEIVENFNQI